MLAYELNITTRLYLRHNRQLNDYCFNFVLRFSVNLVLIP